jgi:hypothetical protein
MPLLVLLPELPPRPRAWPGVFQAYWPLLDINGGTSSSGVVATAGVKWNWPS